MVWWSSLSQPFQAISRPDCMLLWRYQKSKYPKSKSEAFWHICLESYGPPDTLQRLSLCPKLDYFSTTAYSILSSPYFFLILVFLGYNLNLLAYNSQNIFSSEYLNPVAFTLENLASFNPRARSAAASSRIGRAQHHSMVSLWFLCWLKNTKF